MHQFNIKFSDEIEVQFEDIIVLNPAQVDKILTTSLEHTRNEIMNAKSGLKIPLTTRQKKTVVGAKEHVVSGKSSMELHEKQIIEFTDHSIESMIKRYQGDQVACYLAMIDIVKKAKKVHKLAEWKGYSSLAYNILHTINHITYKNVVTFIKEGRNMRIITVMNDDHVDSMDYRISEDDETAQKLLRYRKQLKDGFRE